MQEYITVGFYIVIILVLYLVVAIPQKKRQKEVSTMQASLKMGDVVTTHSGIIGKITEIKDDVITVSSGPDDIKLNVQRWSIISKI